MCILEKKGRCVAVPVLVDTSIRNADISPKKSLSSNGSDENRYRRASLTTEAALVFPVFFFSIVLFWQCFLLLLFQLQVCHEVTKTAMKYSHLGYAVRESEEEKTDISWIYRPLLWNAVPENNRVRNLQVRCQSGDDGTVEVSVSYHFVCETMFFSSFTLPVTQSFSFFPYLGTADPDLFTADKKNEENTVYVTGNGSVYHRSKSCSYLSVALEAVPTEAVSECRNNDGERYGECTRCNGKKEGTVVYISKGGTKYHWSLQCPSVKRNVQEKKEAEVKGMSACHKCGATEQEE